MLLDDKPPHSTKKIGVLLFDHKYIKLQLERKEQEWILSEQEKRCLVKILKKIDRLHSRYSGKKKVWKSILHGYNWELNEKVVSEDLPMPDYMEFPAKN